MGLRKKKYMVDGKYLNRMEVDTMLRYASKREADRILTECRLNRRIASEMKYKEEKDPYRKRKMELLMAEGRWNFEDYGL